jgi:hypothetical protein
MNRTLQPEILDSLPVDHPAALHNRRDLRIINRITGNHRWMRRALAGQLRPGERALELGAGTGELGAVLHRAGLPVDGLDLWPRPSTWPAERAWHQADLRTFDRYHEYAAVCGSLILHQFSATELADVGRRLRDHVRVIVASEPARRRLSQVLFRRLAPLFGANYVSLHDAHVSIAAGFRRRELPEALGLDEANWTLQCRTSLLGLYRMIAVRRE